MQWLALLSEGALPSESRVQIRFSDLDPYQHVSSSRYVDFVANAGWQRYTEIEQRPVESPSAHRLSLDIQFRRPIVGRGEAIVQLSHTRPNVIDFAISSGNISHASGAIEIRPTETIPSPLPNPTPNLPGTPIIYERPLDVRYSDLNAFNEVQLGQHLEYVVTSRWHFVRERYSLDAADFLREGVAFYTSRAQMEFLEPIIGGQALSVRSWVAGLSDDTTELRVPFEIRDLGRRTLYTTGVLTFVVMDVSSQRPQRCGLPEWIHRIFWE